MKKSILTISIIAGFCILLVYFLYSISDKVNNQPNNFVRIFRPNTNRLLNERDLKFDSYYVAGATKKFIYLGNHKNFKDILTIDRSFNQIKQSSLSTIKELYDPGSQLFIDTPYFYLTDWRTNSFLSGRLQSLTATEVKFDSANFDLAVPINSNSLVVRARSRKLNRNIIAKELKKPPQFKRGDTLLEKQIDGIFCTDGMLHYDKNLSTLIYVYFYRNQFLRLDTNLNLIYKANTIDTVTRVKLKVAKISSNNTITISSPPRPINKKSVVSGNLLFIHSSLIADNEEKKNFEQSSVIDVYNLKTGLYQFSFYLKDYKGIKMKNFQVFDGTLISIHGRFILMYSFNQLNP